MPFNGISHLTVESSCLDKSLTRIPVGNRNNSSSLIYMIIRSRLIRAYPDWISDRRFSVANKSTKYKHNAPGRISQREEISRCQLSAGRCDGKKEAIHFLAFSSRTFVQATNTKPLADTPVIHNCHTRFVVTRPTPNTTKAKIIRHFTALKIPAS